MITALIRMSFETYLNGFSLIFVTVSLLILKTDVASANTPAENGRILPHTTRTVPNDLHKLDLLRAEMSSPKGGMEEESRNKLRRMIEQVRSVRFETKVEVIEASVDHDEAPVLEPNEVVSDVPLRKAKESKKIEVELPGKGITEQTLTMLKKSLQSPEKLNDPLELGEILFSSGKTRDAVLFYEEAFRRTDPNDVRLSQDRAWILFQMGNCLRNDEQPAAADTYTKLLIEYPDSPWSDLARVQKELIDWHLKERPHELIKKTGNAVNHRNRH